MMMMMAVVMVVVVVRGGGGSGGGDGNRTLAFCYAGYTYFAALGCLSLILYFDQAKMGNKVAVVLGK